MGSSGLETSQQVVPGLVVCEEVKEEKCRIRS
jgi:hypothetical protein